jgi:plastocyanin
MLVDAKAFLVVATSHGAWGKAATLSEATRNMRRAGAIRGKVKATAVAFTCDPDKVKVFEGPSLQYEWPQTNTHAVRFELDV